MAGRILVIRGGAIGDFILTLPALGLLRDAFPDTRIEILGYRHIVEIAVGRHYADASRSIEYAPLAGFFNPKSDLDPELVAHFAGFHQVISYLYDPDEFFAGNLRRAGVKNLITGDPRIADHAHAAVQLAEPLQKLALFLDDPAPRIHPTESDREEATRWLARLEPPFAAIHPGSGGERKNWPLDRWIVLANHFLSQGRALLIVGGESDIARTEQLRSSLPVGNVRFAEHLPLPLLAAILERCRLFVGHDSGISHLAAATGIPCVLLFGPTDPAIWAPANPAVRVIASPNGTLADIALDSVAAMADSVWTNA
ncbi:MAG: glycosyltransferase family 9 protein [Chthoniobacterales bacterium]